MFATPACVLVLRITKSPQEEETRNAKQETKRNREHTPSTGDAAASLERACVGISVSGLGWLLVQGGGRKIRGRASGWNFVRGR